MCIRDRSSDAGQWNRLKEIFAAKSLQLVSFTITEKGYALQKADGTDVYKRQTYLKGVHAVNVTDNQSSAMRLGSLAMCKVLKDAGMDPIFQLACRDRNRIALERCV